MTPERERLVRALADALYAWNDRPSAAMNMRAVAADEALAAYDAAHPEEAK